MDKTDYRWRPLGGDCMFTGIVAGTGQISSISGGYNNGAIRLVIDFSSVSTVGLVTGASVSVDGVCLTVVEINTSNISFDAIPETLEKTTLGSKAIGDSVNLERALKMGDELGGHILSGHICSTATLLEKIENGDTIDILLKIDSDWMKYILPKGYVALDGISLTVGSTTKEECTCWIHLIPETLSRTTLALKSIGDLINVEIDNQTQAIVDTVERIMKTENEVMK